MVKSKYMGYNAKKYWDIRGIDYRADKHKYNEFERKNLDCLDEFYPFNSII